MITRFMVNKNFQQPGEWNTKSKFLRRTVNLTKTKLHLRVTGFQSADIT
jgi:hypothetical protein